MVPPPPTIPHAHDRPKQQCRLNSLRAQQSAKGGHTVDQVVPAQTCIHAQSLTRFARGDHTRMAHFSAACPISRRPRAQEVLCKVQPRVREEPRLRHHRLHIGRLSLVTQHAKVVPDSGPETTKIRDGPRVQRPRTWGQRPDALLNGTSKGSHLGELRLIGGRSPKRSSHCEIPFADRSWGLIVKL